MIDISYSPRLRPSVYKDMKQNLKTNNFNISQSLTGLGTMQQL